MNTSDPVFQCTKEQASPEDGFIEGRWYFYNETWSDVHGPYNTEDICRTALKKYCEEIL